MIEILENLTKTELIDLIVAYNDYIIELSEDLQCIDRVPVCLMEFYDYEYQDLKQGGMGNV